MKPLVLHFLLFVFCSLAYAQESEKITSISFIQVIDDNREETIYYYENNWKVLRKRAIEEGYIDSYRWLEVPYSEEAPYHFMLFTTYKNKEQFDRREDNFAILIEEKGPLRLLNEKKSSEIRKIVYDVDTFKHWE
ncbi:MAG: hypothetical protein AAGA77_01765 [Bacteroidota bacterium]